MAVIDYSTLTTEQLYLLRQEAEDEISRRLALEGAESRIEQIAADYLQAVGREPGAAWVQPTGAHDAYPAGWQVTVDGTVWESTTPNNVWKPGTSGWRQVGGAGGEPAAWIQPTGAHDAYQTGDVVSFAGGTYRSKIDGNTWSPTAYPSGWEAI